VNAAAPIKAESRPRWRRRLSVAIHRSRFVPVLELLTVTAVIGVALLSYSIVKDRSEGETLLSPPAVAGLLVANLVPAMLVMVLIARRLAMHRAARSALGGRGRLHVRLVALFSIIASVPTLLVVIFASLLFQNGLQFWFSERSQTVLASAEHVSQIYAREHRARIELDVQTMGGDVVKRINEFGLYSQLFKDAVFYQAAVRQLQEAAILRIGTDGKVHNDIYELNLDHRDLVSRFPPSLLRTMKAGQVLSTTSPDRMEAVVRLDPDAEIFFYGSRYVNPSALAQIGRAKSALGAYRTTLDNTRKLQFRFNAILLLVSLLIVAIAIWIALAIADRMVRPVGQLVDAARRIGGGDLSVRVPGSRVHDEVATLGSVFNRMTRRLEEQTGALVSANSQLDSRRAFIEAVLSGVTAGVVSVDRNRHIRLINSSAEALLKTAKEKAVGQPLARLAPELDAQLDSDEREGIVQLASAGEPRTLAVKRVKVEGGHVLTFDDITEQLLDQRRAAWSDVARRIAHEIKNPLTPIQLAAERLQRRYGKEIASDPETFEQLTGTIVRQVGDLRRMVDEFSSFARMPKPVFNEEAVAEIARHALFLHEVAHPDIAFVLDAPEPSPLLVCDRRQLGQALTNIVKNGVEAIQQKREEKGKGEGPDSITIRILEGEGRLCIEIADTGMGLPVERSTLTEPYVTTRVKGTGLGLAIVKKIVEEHFGSIEFEDAQGGGTLVRLVFDAETLARLGGGAAEIHTGKAANG
jgi:two-component system nitrogen regulation sensor histidine kinase NtrY